MHVQENLDQIRRELEGAKVKLIAISKTFSPEIIQQAYNAGQRAFGENKVQELLEKYEHLPADIEWHLVGHLQRNKVKYIAPFISYIHSVDSLKLLREVNKEALKNNRVIHCLLQVYIADEVSKFGMDEKEVHALLNSGEFREMHNVRIKGLMGMATFTDDGHKIRMEFRRLKQFFMELKPLYFHDDDDFREISMGMSGDWRIAIEEGSTMVRIGSAIFGNR